MDCSFSTINPSKVKRDQIIGNNIYDSYEYRKLQDYRNKLIYKNTIRAWSPMQTGIIPNFYNQLQSVAKRQAYYKHKYLINNNIKKIELNEIKKLDPVVEMFGTQNNNIILMIIILSMLFLIILFYV